MERRFTRLLVGLLVLAPCWASGGALPPPAPSDEGEVYVYLQPLPVEAERITFSIDAATAVNSQGGEVALRLSFTTARQPENRRQRLFASGRLPTGSYAGLSITIQKASVKRASGAASLLVPDRAVRVDAPFLVARGKALVVWLTLNGGDAAPAGASFSPAFSAQVAPRPMVSRAGFASNSRSNSITVFDKRLRQATGVILTGAGPSGMALDQRSGRLYVACQAEDEVQVIDVSAAEIIERTRVFAGDRPREVALTPDGRTLVSVNTGSDSISVFDADPLTRLERIPVGSGPVSLVIDPAGRRVFVFNAISSSISVVDIARRSLVATIPTDSAPLRGQFNASGDKLLVIHERSPYVTVVDPQQLTVTTRARLKSGIAAIKVDVRRNLVYIGGDDTMVEFYDPNALLPIDAMRTPGTVAYLAIDAEDNSLYMVSPDTRSLVIGSLADRKVASEIDVGEGPYWVVVMGEK